VGAEISDWPYLDITAGIEAIELIEQLQHGALNFAFTTRGGVITDMLSKATNTG
jgi:hypothetical protein